MSIREELAAAAQRRDVARREERAALLEIRALLRAAHEYGGGEGLTFSEAISVAGISRRSAYLMLGDGK